MMRCGRRDFLKAMGTGAAALALPRLARAADTPKAPRPNVVLVMTDDQGYGDLACHGNPVIRTPNLDALHKESLRLTNFHVDPTCSPTRSALMAGRYSSRTGVWHTIAGRSLLRKDEVTLADVFAAGGYKTGIFGKWHLGDNYPFRPQDRGFQEVLVHGGGGVGQTPDFWGNKYFDDTYWHNGTPQKFTGYCTDVWFDGAMKFIEANKDRPFFCYIPTNAPHGPYLVAEKYVKPYLAKGVKAEGSPPQSIAAGGPAQAHFYGMITNIDENMGRLVKKLKELHLEDNTILIFMTDNGTSGGWQANMRGQKGSPYDGGHRVPFFIRWGTPAAIPARRDGGDPSPGHVKGGRDVDRIAAHVDVLPTLAELCGLAKPKDVKLDGMSLAPLITGDGAGWPDRTLLVHSQRIEHPLKWRQCAVMTDRWRLVDGKELYDMKADPAQKTDVAAQNAEVVAKLRAAYEAWWTDISKRFDEYCEIIIGSDKDNPSRITCHDWHGQNVPWNQGAIRQGPRANGFWAIEVDRDGKYEFELRRWAKEVDKPVEATQARLKIGEVDQTKEVPTGATAATFTVKLKAGKTRMQTWLTGDKAGQGRGAFYVYVKRVS